MRSVKLYFFIICCSICINLKAQDKRIDSLKLILQNAKHDTVKLRALVSLAEIAPEGVWQQYNNQLYEMSSKKISLQNNTLVRKVFYSALGTALNNKGYEATDKSKFDSAIYFQRKSLKYYELAGDTLGIASSLHNLAVVYKNLDDLEKAILYNTQALNLERKLKKYGLMAKTLNNIGLIQYNQGKISEALNCFYESLKYREQEKDTLGIANTFTNIGLAYTSQGDKNKAMEYFKSSLKIKLTNKQSTSNVYLNIAKMYNSFNLTDSAKYYFDLVYHSSVLEKNKRNEMFALNGLGLCDLEKNNYKSALNYFNKSQEICQLVDDKQAYCTILNNKANCYYKQNNLISASDLANKSYLLSKEIGYVDNIKKSTYLLYQIYQQKKDYKKALEMYQLFNLMKDSINNLESRKASIKAQYKYEYEKKLAADSVKVGEERKVAEAELKQEKTQRYALYGGLGLVALFAIFMVNRFRITNRQRKLIEIQKKIVEQQKQVVEEKQKEVLDSIYYARRIQNALITSDYYISKEMKRLTTNKK